MEDIGAKEGDIMKKRKYEEFVPDGDLIEIPNFLPPPDQLVFPGEETVKVTLSLTKRSVEFFKKKAKSKHAKYQKMIREVVDRYARHY